MDNIVLEDFHPVFMGASSQVVLLKYSAYDAGYSVEDVQPAWVGYRLNRNRVGGSAERANKFQREPRLRGLDANDRDYAGSGFDKGHLVPAADMAWSVQSMMESFSYANVSPQLPGFNRGIWKRLESQVRDWAATLTVDDTVGLFVWSGPVLSKNSTL
ncbi:MAG: DNA/RNA non-specific endonuclease, partial [Bacteroidota bacterium]